MATNISIGADELILWLRKNGGAQNICNDDLGKRIHQIIVDHHHGQLDEEDAPAFWDCREDSRNIAPSGQCLPKTAAQYTISTANIGRVYEELSRLFP